MAGSTIKGLEIGAAQIVVLHQSVGYEEITLLNTGVQPALMRFGTNQDLLKSGADLPRFTPITFTVAPNTKIYIGGGGGTESRINIIITPLDQPKPAPRFLR